MGTIRNWAGVFSFSSVLLFSSSVIAGALSGNPDSIDWQLRERIVDAMEARGLMPRSQSSAFEVAIRAYLWENRNHLVTTEVSKRREVDLVTCLLGFREGDTAVQEFSSPPFQDWCIDQLRELPTN